MPVFVFGCAGSSSSKDRQVSARLNMNDFLFSLMEFSLFFLRSHPQKIIVNALSSLGISNLLRNYIRHIVARLSLALSISDAILFIMIDHEILLEVVTVDGKTFSFMRGSG